MTGNTVIDALRWVVKKLSQDTALRSESERVIAEAGYPTGRLTGMKRLVLITGHRRENFGEGFIHVCEAIRYLSDRYPDVDFVYPMHLNPNVRGAIERYSGRNGAVRRICFLSNRWSTLSFVCLMEKSDIVLTDGGGIQKRHPASENRCWSCAI